MPSFHDLLFAEGSHLNPIEAAIRAALVFIAAIILVRWAKRRFIAQASPMDMVMMVVYGSTLSRAINGGGTFAASMAAAVTLVLLQRLFAILSFHYPAFDRFVKGRAEVLVDDGKVDSRALREHALTLEDLYADIRLNGNTEELVRVKKAVIERSGQISVVTQE